MVEIVKPIYEDLRDVNKFVKSILNSRTYVTRLGEVLHVRFPSQHSKKGAEALDELCATLNSNDGLDSGLSFKRIVFGVRGKN